jgi:hypothetical protein
VRSGDSRASGTRPSGRKPPETDFHPTGTPGSGWTQGVGLQRRRARWAGTAPADPAAVPHRSAPAPAARRRPTRRRRPRGLRAVDGQHPLAGPSAARPTGRPRGVWAGSSSGGRHGTLRGIDDVPTVRDLTVAQRIRPRPTHRPGLQAKPPQRWRRRGRPATGGHRCPGSCPRAGERDGMDLSRDSRGRPPGLPGARPSATRREGRNGKGQAGIHAPRRLDATACVGFVLGPSVAVRAFRAPGPRFRVAGVQATRTVPIIPRLTCPGTSHHMSYSPAVAVQTKLVVSPPAMVADVARFCVPRSPM